MLVQDVRLDLRKAYVRVEWVFLDRVLKAVGFKEQFRKLIMECLGATSLSILLNGNLLPLFDRGGDSDKETRCLRTCSYFVGRC